MGAALEIDYQSFRLQYTTYTKHLFSSNYYQSRIMPNQRKHKFAPKYEHDKPMPPAATDFVREWKNMREELLEGMKAVVLTTTSN